MNSLQQDHNDRYNQVRIQQNAGTPCEDCGCESGHKVYCPVLVSGYREHKARTSPDTVGFLRGKLAQKPEAVLTDVVFSSEDQIRLRSLGVVIDKGN